MHLDGVTAMRIVLHMLEILELGDAAPPTTNSNFADSPTYEFSMERVLNLLILICWLVLDLCAYPWRAMWKLLTCQSIEPNCPEGWTRHFCNKNHEPCDIVLFTTAGDRFKTFVEKVDQWRQEVGLSFGFMFLMNFTPHVGMGAARTAEQLMSRKARQERLLAPPGAPEIDMIRLVYLFFHRRMLFNNYGRHCHKFSAKPAAFCWDWLNFPATMTCAFVVNINGELLCGIRGVSKFVESGRSILGDVEAGFGPGRRLTQIVHHPRQGWTGRKPKTRAETSLEV
mmetsp:Transcript_22437/g.63095  ORF Transcript_22437/g.63095 Transcript_22437/m.63095 type:complete len:283 (+) Transcript_22437:390-1238(+)